MPRFSCHVNNMQDTQILSILCFQCTYYLQSIICHKGGSSTSGHYVAHVKVDQTWWAFDDNNVGYFSFKPRKYHLKEDV